MDQAELKEFYARMNDGELEAVAGEAYDLTDAARPLLKDEIARRGLKIPLRTERVARRVAAGELRLVDTVWSSDSAQQVKQFLDAEGIPGYWGPDNVESPEALRFDDGVELKVREEDSARVMAGLGRLFPRVAELEEKEWNFACPKCQSPEIVFRDLDEETEKFNWSCEACGHEWNDDGVG